MRELGLRGARRGRPVLTTRPDPRSERAPDLVDRDFTATAPNRLWVVDMTYVRTWSGMVFTAFVSDVFSRRIVGWRCSTTMPTQLPLDALEMALWTREWQVTPRHSRIGNTAPVEHENHHYAHQPARERLTSGEPSLH